MALIDNTASARNGFRQPAYTNYDNSPFVNGLNLPTNFIFGITPATANICDVQILPLDANLVSPNVNISQSNSCTGFISMPVTLWLSDSALGQGLTATTASGTVQARSSYGVDLVALVAKKMLMSQCIAAPDSTNSYTLRITDTAKTGFYVVVRNNFSGQIFVSRQLTSADYG